MESIGISESLATLNLDEDMPKCCIFSSRSQKYQWARGYEDDGRLESNREYPVLCLISSQLKKCPASWVAGSGMISIHDDEVGWKLNHHYHEACDVLRKIKPTPARNTDDNQNDQNSTPFLEVADTRTSLHEKGESNPEPESSTQPETFPDPNGGPFSETTSENRVHQNDKIESESTAQNSESGTASKNESSSFSAETGQTQHESGGFEESYLENLAHTSLNYARNKADMMEGGNCETNRPDKAATGQFIAREHTEMQQGEHHPSASYTPPIVGAQAPGGETSNNVTGPNAQEASQRTRAQIGEMFNEIERHMVERQIHVPWASGPANPGLSSQASTSAQSYQASSMDTYPHLPQTDRHQIPPSQNTYHPPSQGLNSSSTLPPLNPSSRTHRWLPPLTSRGGHKTLSPHNTVVSAHQGATRSHFQPEVSTQEIQPGQYLALPDDWRQFDPGPLRDDLDHWVRQYNRSPGIGSLMKENGGFFCPFCPPTTQMAFPQPWDIVDHLLKTHPTGFWVRPAQIN
jgi:hypothetical protein